MGILRGALEFERDFTRIPNAWARDERLSRRARGLLVEIMSHRVGWHVSIASLIEAGTEGRHAVRAAIDELRSAGYLEVEQGRGTKGQFGEVEYRLIDPAVRKSDSGGGVTGVRSSAVGSPDVGGSPSYKEDQPKEDQTQEDQLSLMVIGGPTFDDFWSNWPRKDAKKTAQAAWSRAVKRAPAEVILAAARAYAESPYRPEKQYVPHAATWLNGERWNDPLPEPRGGARPAPVDRVRSAVDAGARVQAAIDRGELIA